MKDMEIHDQAEAHLKLARKHRKMIKEGQLKTTAGVLGRCWSVDPDVMRTMVTDDDAGDVVGQGRGQDMAKSRSLNFEVMTGYSGMSDNSSTKATKNMMKVHTPSALHHASKTQDTTMEGKTRPSSKDEPSSLPYSDTVGKYTTLQQGRALKPAL